VDRNINTISSLVLDMLEFSKDREPDYAKNNINTLITQIAELYREKAQSAGITFDISLDSSIPEFYFDSTGIHRCILNLLSNSFDAVNNTDNPIIKLAVHNNSNQETIITVTDNGYGMTQEIIDKIMMSNFFSTKGSKGTGLGLPITRKIIHEHNGTLNITSSPGEGTTFTISIPVIFHNPLNE
jgi:signal transduction histidine kinase